MFMGMKAGIQRGGGVISLEDQVQSGAGAVLKGRQKKEEVGKWEGDGDKGQGRSSMDWKELKVKDAQAGSWGRDLNPCLSWDVLFIASVTLA